MNKNFISKLETKNYLIGSFDAYQDKSKELIKRNSNLSDEEVETIFKSLLTTYRAAIVNKENNQYIGYIGLYNIDAKNNTSSLRFEDVDTIYENVKNEIIEEYKKYLNESLNIQNIEEFIFTTKENINIEKKEFTTNANMQYTRIRRRGLEKYLVKLCLCV